jgi:hypothetical protein
MDYSGFSPFVGAGVNLGGWSFAIGVSKGKHELIHTVHPEAFEVRDLYLEICSVIAHLGLENVAVEDKLCVNGQDIRGDARFLPDFVGTAQHFRGPKRSRPNPRQPHGQRVALQTDSSRGLEWRVGPEHVSSARQGWPQPLRRIHIVCAHADP